MSNLTTAPPTPVPAFAPESRVDALHRRFRHLENQVHYQLVEHSITALRIALGIVFFGFGILKYFNGISPAQTIVEQTTHVLFLTLIPGSVSIKIIATLECFIGLCLLANRWMRLCVWLLAFEFIGILSPIVIFPGHLFSGPHHAPTLLGQYCLKDIILVAGGLVVTAASFRGGRLTRTDLPPHVHTGDVAKMTPEHKLRVVLDGLNDPDNLPALCADQGITEGVYLDWRRDALAGAMAGLATVPAGLGALAATPVAMSHPSQDSAQAPIGQPRRPGTLSTALAILLLTRG